MHAPLDRRPPHEQVRRSPSPSLALVLFLEHRRADPRCLVSRRTPYSRCPTTPLLPPHLSSVRRPPLSTSTTTTSSLPLPRSRRLPRTATAPLRRAAASTARPTSRRPCRTRARRACRRAGLRRRAAQRSDLRCARCRRDRPRGGPARRAGRGMMCTRRMNGREWRSGRGGRGRARARLQPPLSSYALEPRRDEAARLLHRS